jgi:hypothetical protein
VHDDDDDDDRITRRFESPTHERAHHGTAAGLAHLLVPRAILETRKLRS